MIGQPVQRDLRPLGRAPLQHLWCAMIAGVVQNQMPAPIWVACLQPAQEVAKLHIAVVLIALSEDSAGVHIKGGQQINNAVTDVLELASFDLARAQRQGRVPTLQGLDAGLLIYAQQPTVPRWRQIQIDDRFHLPLKLRVGARQPVAHPMRLQHYLGQNPLDRRGTHRDDFAAPGHQPRQVAHAVVREPAEVPLPSLLTSYAYHHVAGLRGKKPAGVPTGTNPPAPAAALTDPPPAPAAGFSPHTEQTACATSAPSCAMSPSAPRSPGYSCHHRPAGWPPRAWPPAVASSQPGAAPRSAAALQRSTVSHTADVTWPPPSFGDGHHYTANELMRQGTSGRWPAQVYGGVRAGESRGHEKRCVGQGPRHCLDRKDPSPHAKSRTPGLSADFTRQIGHERRSMSNGDRAATRAECCHLERPPARFMVGTWGTGDALDWRSDC